MESLFANRDHLVGLLAVLGSASFLVGTFMLIGNLRRMVRWRAGEQQPGLVRRHGRLWLLPFALLILGAVFIFLALVDIAR